MTRTQRVLSTVVAGALFLGLGTCSVSVLVVNRCPSPLPARVLYGARMAMVESVVPCLRSYREAHGEYPPDDVVKFPARNAAYQRDEETGAYRIHLPKGFDCGVTYDGAEHQWVLETGMRAPARSVGGNEAAACESVIEQ